MVLSSNSLFHFTSNLDNIKNILKEGFSPRYCCEYGWDNKKIDFVVPMVCFCDIPLSMIHEHTKFYGKYGIGVSREWIKSHKSITPVQYIERESYEFNYINRLLTRLNNKDIDETGIKKLVLAKKVAGKAINKETKKLSNKRFYNEREWRYVPYKIGWEQCCLSILKGDIFDTKTNADILNDNRLIISIESIQYLIIPNEQSRIEMIKAIKDVYIGHDNDKLLILMSKILTLDQIKNDF